MLRNLAQRLEALENEVRRINVRGVIAEVDPSRGQGGSVRVRYGDNQLSGWLPVKPARSGQCSVWSFPDVGEGCTVTNIDTGEVVPGSFTASMPPPTKNPDEVVIKFADGSTIVHNESSGEITINTTSKVNVISPNIESTGSWKHNGTMIISDTLEVQSELAVLSTSQLVGVVAMPSGFTSGGAGGASASMNGSLKLTGGDITVKGISAYSHTHLDAEGRPTGKPT